MKRPPNARLAAGLPPLLIAALALSGCADDRGGFPSLLPRAIEQHDDLEPVHAAPVLTADPALDAAIADADKRLADATARFADESGKAATSLAAAGNAEQGSDAWLGAQQALGALDHAQADTTNIAADLDRLAIDRAKKGLPDYPALSALRGRVQAELDTESRRLATLRATLKA